MTPTTPHPWAKELHALADGATILQKRTDEVDTPGAWRSLDPYDGGMLALIRGDTEQHEFKIKPRTIIVNGREIPAPYDNAPEAGMTYYVPSPKHKLLRAPECWNGDGEDRNHLERGIAHITEAAAIAHAKAWMGLE